LSETSFDTACAFDLATGLNTALDEKMRFSGVVLGRFQLNLRVSASPGVGVTLYRMYVEVDIAPSFRPSGCPGPARGTSHPEHRQALLIRKKALSQSFRIRQRDEMTAGNFLDVFFWAFHARHAVKIRSGKSGRLFPPEREWGCRASARSCRAGRKRSQRTASKRPRTSSVLTTTKPSAGMAGIAMSHSSCLPLP
jgi:hypothetical protein